jgi:hypothetical protein
MPTSAPEFFQYVRGRPKPCSMTGLARSGAWSIRSFVPGKWPGRSKVPRSAHRRRNESGPDLFATPRNEFDGSLDLHASKIDRDSNSLAESMASSTTLSLATSSGRGPKFGSPLIGNNKMSAERATTAAMIENSPR